VAEKTGVGLGEWLELGLGVKLGDRLGVGGVPVGEAEGVGDGLPLTVRLADGNCDAVGVPVGEAVPVADGDGDEAVGESVGLPA
jgi:hypothetical protein